MSRRSGHEGTSPMLSSLEKAAILLANLDRETADRLLQQLPAEQAIQLRHAVMGLDPQLEQLTDAVLQDFLAQVSQPPTQDVPAHRPAAWFDTSDLRAGHSAGAPSASCSAAPLPAAELDMLGCEQPQLIAATLAAAPPKSAADWLDRMPLELQAEVMRRMARLERVPATCIHGLWEALHHRQQVQASGDVPFTKDSLATVRRVLRAHHPGSREALLDRLSHVEPRLAEWLGTELDASSSAASQRRRESALQESLM